MSKLETRKRIIEAALTLFGERGYTSTSTREIAERASVNHLTLFRHFGNKENLFRESVIQHLTSGDFINSLRPHLTGNLTNDLEIIAKYYLEENLNKEEIFWISLSESKKNPEVAQLIFEIPQRLSDFLAKYLSELYEQDKIRYGNYQMLGSMFFSLLSQYIIYWNQPVFQTLYPGDMNDFIHETTTLFISRLEHPIQHNNV